METVKLEIEQFAATGAPMLALSDRDALELLDGFEFDLASTTLDIDALDSSDSCSGFTTDADDCASLRSHSSSDSDMSSECADATSAPSSPVQLPMQMTHELKQQPQQQPNAYAHSRIIVSAPTAQTTSKQVAIQPSPSTTAAARSTPLKRPRKHNRIEILKLKDEVEVLEERAAKLRKQVGASNGAQSSAVALQYARRYGPKTLEAATSYPMELPRSVWLDVAVEQYAALLKAQSLNRKLRAAIANQFTVGSAMQELLTSQAVIQDTDVLNDIARATAARDAECDVLDCTDLYASVDDLVLDAGLVSRVIAYTSDASAASHTSCMKHDATRGPTFEVTTNTRITCDALTLSRMVWRRIVDNCDARWGPATRRSPSLHQRDLHERRVHVVFPTSVGDIHAVGATVMKQLVTAQHSAIAFATKWMARDCGLVLRETTWLITADASVDASELEPLQLAAQAPATSLYQTFYRTWCERADAASATGSVPFTASQDEQLQVRQEALARCIGERMRDHIVQLQNGMVSEMSVALARNTPFQLPVFKCPY